MNLAPIRNEQDYQSALNRLEEIFDAKKGTEKGNDLEILSILNDNSYASTLRCGSKSRKY